jgi:predicted Zn-dependent peptidase
VQRQYTGANVVVAVAVAPAAADADAVRRAAEVAFGDMPAGTPHHVAPAAYRGDVRTRAIAGSGQAHLLVGGALAPLAADDPAGTLAAAVFGEGMSSPLLLRVREERALAYHATCAADVLDFCGQFVVEASTAPEGLDDCAREVAVLLRQHARRVDPVDLERAKHQLRVRRLRAQEKPMQQLEEAALDLFTFGRVRALSEQIARLDALDAEAVRALFERLLADGLSAVAVGQVGRAAGERLRKSLAA